MLIDMLYREKLPYLSAVIKEGLRLSYGVSMRTARIATEEDLVYRGEWNKKNVEYVIPRGYAIGMSTVITHHDETIFPDSHKFLPERWLDAENKLRKELEKGFMPFARGSRACLASKYVTRLRPLNVLYGMDTDTHLTAWPFVKSISWFRLWLCAYGRVCVFLRRLTRT